MSEASLLDLPIGCGEHGGSLHLQKVQQERFQGPNAPWRFSEYASVGSFVLMMEVNMYVLLSGLQRFSGRFDHFSSAVQKPNQVMAFEQRVVS